MQVASLSPRLLWTHDDHMRIVMLCCGLQIGEYEETIGTCIAFTEQGELQLIQNKSD